MPSETLHRLAPALRSRARELRQPQTPAEEKLWHTLRGRNLGGYKFRRQHPIDRFIVDFYCAEVKLVVEIDGDIHATQLEYDAARTERLEELGCTVIRFTNDNTLNYVGNVANAILETCQRLAASTDR